jgi:hypothetical protein
MSPRRPVPILDLDEYLELLDGERDRAAAVYGRTDNGFMRQGLGPPPPPPSPPLTAEQLEMRRIGWTYDTWLKLQARDGARAPMPRPPRVDGPTLLEWARRLDPGGHSRRVAEYLEQIDSLLSDPAMLLVIRRFV